MPRKAIWTTTDTTTVMGFFVLVGCGLETTISSNITTHLLPAGARPAGRPSLPRFLFPDGGPCYRPLAAPAIPGDDYRSGNTKAGVCSYHNPYHQGKGESTKHLAAHQEQDEHVKESQTTG